MALAMAMAKITESIKSKAIGSKSLVSIHLKVKLRNSAKCVIFLVAFWGSELRAPWVWLETGVAKESPIGPILEQNTHP